MEMKTARQWLPSTEEMLANRGNAPEMPIKSIPKLDTFLWGLHRKQLMIIGARPSNGKSILAVQLAWDMVKQGKSVYFMSLEMTCERIMERIFSQEFLVDNDFIMRGGFNKDVVMRSKWGKFKEILKTSRFVMSDMIGRNVQDIHNIDKAFEKKPDILIIDHLNEIGGDQKKSAAIETYLDTLRAMAIRSNVALVICCQVNRASMSDGDKTPQLHNLKGAGAIEEKADQVVLLHFPHLYDDSQDKNKIEIHVAKNRFGKTGYGSFNIQPEFSLISDSPIITTKHDTEVNWNE